MVDEDLQEGMYSILSRTKWLSKYIFMCPKCHKGPLRLVGVKVAPKWICDSCHSTHFIEPIKNVTPRSSTEE